MARDESDRSFPPSPRRLGLARQAGLHAASPLLVGGAACAVAALAFAALGGAIAERLAAAARSAIADAGLRSPDPRLGHESGALGVSGLSRVVIELALPVLAIIALAALTVHLAQTRAGWLPRRRIDNAPALPADAGARTRRAGFEIVAAIAIGGVAFAWLWLIAPRLAALPTVPLAAVSLIAAALATFAVAWVAIGVIHAVLRHAELGRALRMTSREKRDDERLSSGDPRWRELRRKLAREPRGRSREPRSLDAVAGATLLLLGDDIAVSIAWDPVHRPIPTRLAVGRGVLATQLLGLARRHRTPVHREHALTAALVGSDGSVDEVHWPRLAEIVAAVKR